MKEAAREAGIGEKTLRRWLKIPEFAAEYEEQRRKAFDPTKEALAEVGPQAVYKLREIMADPFAKDRVPAAKCVLDASHKIQKLEDKHRAGHGEGNRGEVASAQPLASKPRVVPPPASPSAGQQEGRARKKGQEAREPHPATQPQVGRGIATPRGPVSAGSSPSDGYRGY